MVHTIIIMVLVLTMLAFGEFHDNANPTCVTDTQEQVTPGEDK